MRTTGALAVCLAAVVTACGAGPPTVSAGACDRFRTAFAAASQVEPSDQLAALRELVTEFPGQRLEAFLDALSSSEQGFAAASTEAEAFAVGIDLAVAMHELADVAPVGDELAAAITASCGRDGTEVARAGPDAATSEPSRTVGLAVEGTVDAFVAALAEAHRRTDGQGCEVLRQGLDVAAGVRVTPHLAADVRSGELGCVFTDPSGPVLLVVLALDGAVSGRLAPLVDSPGSVVSLTDVFGLAGASGVAGYDADSDGWLIALTAGSPDPRDAIRRLEATLS